LSYRCAQSGHPVQGPGVKGPSKIAYPTDDEVIININRRCKLGELLNATKVSELTSTYGPLPAGKMIQVVMQMLLDCAIDTKAIIQFVRQGNGKVVTVGRTRLKLKTIESKQEFWEEVKIFLHSIGCCERLVGEAECTRCTVDEKKSVPPELQSFGKRASVDSANGSPGHIPPDHPAKVMKLPELQKISGATPPKPNSFQTQSGVTKPTATATATTSSPRMQQHVQPLPPPPPLAVAPYQQRQSVNVHSSSRVEPPPPPTPPQTNGQSRIDPSDWSVEEVILHITSIDSSMAVHAEIFRRHVWFFIIISLVFKFKSNKVCNRKE